MAAQNPPAPFQDAPPHPVFADCQHHVFTATGLKPTTWPKQQQQHWPQRPPVGIHQAHHSHFSESAQPGHEFSILANRTDPLITDHLYSSARKILRRRCPNYVQLAHSYHCAILTRCVLPVLPSEPCSVGTYPCPAEGRPSTCLFLQATTLDRHMVSDVDDGYSCPFDAQKGQTASVIILHKIAGCVCEFVSSPVWSRCQVAISPVGTAFGACQQPVVIAWPGFRPTDLGRVCCWSKRHSYQHAGFHRPIGAAPRNLAMRGYNGSVDGSDRRSGWPVRVWHSKE